MRVTLILLTLFIIQTTKGQNNLADLNAYIKKTENISELSNLKSVQFDSLSILSTFNELERQIDFGFKHHRILIVPYSGSDLKLNLVSKNGEIQITWISEFDPSNDVNFNILNVPKNSDFLKEYVQNHNGFYKTELTESDFENQIINEYVVGFGCSIDGLTVPKESKKMLKLVKRKNREELNKYLTSFSPELQTLGAIGLLKIGKLTKEQKNIIKHLKNKNSVIYSCSGCSYGIGETFSERIENYE
ncbi:hypothetical protein [Xanthomarina sp. GH4-25]|uniref:hypothetical protein n=1 Tax=Xanthomarina sp. GH4-25 TaxID=3349335 RepID=UPI00387839E4